MFMSGRRQPPRGALVGGTAFEVPYIATPNPLKDHTSRRSVGLFLRVSLNRVN